MKYKFILTTEVEIEAPNVAKAFEISKRIKIIGTGCGVRRDRHNRDYWCYETTVLSTKVHCKGHHYANQVIQRSGT